MTYSLNLCVWCVWYIYMIWQFLFSRPFFFFASYSSSSSSFVIAVVVAFVAAAAVVITIIIGRAIYSLYATFAEFSYIKPHRLRIFPVNVWMRVCKLRARAENKWTQMNRCKETDTHTLARSDAMRENEKKIFFLAQFCHVRWMRWWYMLFGVSGFFSSSIITTHQNVLDIHWLLSKIAHTNRFFFFFLLLPHPQHFSIEIDGYVRFLCGVLYQPKFGC